MSFTGHSFSDSSLEDGSVLSDFESESSMELEDSVGCEEAPEDVSDLESVEVSVTDAGLSELLFLVEKRGAVETGK